MTESSKNKSNIGKCALCDTEEVELKESHSIPKFAYDWIKETSKTPYLRQTNNVNERLQDGPKQYLLCNGCEGYLSEMENKISRKLFKKIANYRGQSQKITVSEGILIGILSIFWRAILTSKDEENNRTAEDNEKLDEFLMAAKAEIRERKRKTKIYFVPFFGDAPYYALPAKMTYFLERGIGGRDARFCDEPHRYYITFKLPFMYFYIFSDGWSRDEVEKSFELFAGEVRIDGICEIPQFIRDYIVELHDQFEESKLLMSETSRDRIREEFEKNKNITGSDKSMERSRE